jgi:transposase InsO family protein
LKKYDDYRPHQALGYETPVEWYFAPESHGAKPAAWA